jgi:hypothetical protein
MRSAFTARVTTGRARQIALTFAAAAIGALAGIQGVGHPKQAIGFGIAVVAVALLVTWLSSGGAYEQTHRWVPLAWVVLLLVTDLHLEDVGPLEIASGGVGVSHVIELTIYASVAALILQSRRALLPLHPVPVPKGLLVAWPALAAVSAVWSPVALFSLARAYQLLVLVALGLLTVRIWLTDSNAGERIWRATLRLFVRVVTVLAVLGFVLQPWTSPDSVSSRFTWPATHPGLASTYLGVAFIVLVVGGRSLTHFPAWSHWGRVGFFGAAIYLGQTRSVIGATVLGIAVGLWIQGRRKPIVRYLGVGYYLVGIGLLAGLATRQVFAYLSRGEDISNITSLTGRVPLWEFAIGQLNSLWTWLAGFGYDSSRTILYPKVSWAGSAHSSWIELLIGVGVIGLLLAAMDIVVLLVHLVRSRFFARPNELAVSLVAYLIVVAFVSETLVIPGVGFGFLAIAHVPALVQRGWEIRKTRTSVVSEGAGFS